MVAFLTGTSNRELDTGRMPRTDASNLSQTFVSLAGKFAGVPTGSNTCIKQCRLLKSLWQETQTKHCLKWIGRKAIDWSTRLFCTSISAYHHFQHQLSIQHNNIHTFVALALGYTDNIYHFILGEHRRNRNGLLQVLAGPVNFLGDGSTIDLDLHDVGFLLALMKKFHLIKTQQKNDHSLHKTQAVLLQLQSIQTALAG